MTNIAQVVTKNAQELTVLLEAVKSKMEAVEMLYPLLEQVSENSAESSELRRLMVICGGHFADTIHTIADRVKYLAKERTEGKLVIGEGGKYTLDTAGRVFSCGSNIEVYIEEPGHDHGWQFGRVEHRESMGGYYFRNYSGDDHRLYPGILAAVRY